MQEWLRSDVFDNWAGSSTTDMPFPLARIPETDAGLIGSRTTIAALSRETMVKQLRQHPELTLAEYAAAQEVVIQATRKVQDGSKSLIYVREVAGANGYVLVVKATQTGAGLFVTSFRRLSADQARRDRTIRQLLRKEL